MKLKDILGNYYEITGKASDVARQLAFAGFAAIWVFRQGTDGLQLPRSMFVPAAVFGLALIADVLQYGVAAWRWRVQADHADDVCKTEEDDCEVPHDINKWPRIFFTIKLWAVGVAYATFIGALVQIMAAT